MGTLAAAGTSNSKTATEPPDASPSSRNRTANCPILTSLVGLVAMRTPPPVLGASAAIVRHIRLFFTHFSAVGPPVLPTLGLLTSIHQALAFSETRRGGTASTCRGLSGRRILVACRTPTHATSPSARLAGPGGGSRQPSSPSTRRKIVHIGHD